MWLKGLGYKLTRRDGSTSGCAVNFRLNVFYWAYQLRPPWVSRESSIDGVSQVLLFETSFIIVDSSGESNQARMTDLFEEATNRFLVEWLKDNQ